MKTEKKTGPLYYIIKEDLKRKIEEESLKPGDVLPTEGQLCEEYHASRVTIRRAINELITENVLERGFGKTATVKCENVPRSLNHLGGLHEELEQAGIKCSSFILETKVIEVPAEVAGHMGLQEKDKVLEIERLRYDNGRPLCYQLLYLDYELCGDLDVKELASSSLYEMLEHKLGIQIDTATQTIQAAMTTYRIAALLELPEQTCMLQVNRTAYEKSGRCFEYSESSYVSSRYTLTMTLKR